MQGRNNQGNNQERNNQGTQETRNSEQEQKKTGNPIIKRILVECISLVSGIVILLFMTGLYTAILELLLMPLKIEVKKQITDFMEEN